jgi:hypothetical protein
MTSERKIIVGIEDIKAITFECTKDQCRARISLSPNVQADAPHACPQCGVEWRTGVKQRHDFTESAVQKLTGAVADLTAIKRTNPLNYRVLFEFEEPKF